MLREQSLPGFVIEMTMDDFQNNGIRQDVTESLKSAVRYSIPLDPRCFRRKMLSLSGLKGVAAAAYSFSNLVRCKCHC